ncbi:DUF5132 domain-containing protein [Methyloferula stellata]|uniref:DUF5132 domain-containing protein n=1 Tax=Methyloferula stellata TaxID=876270 RepID=UPI000369523B|nr:DUF5132 domain-containing protein [Methyloferula stellata]
MSKKATEGSHEGDHKTEAEDAHLPLTNGAAHEAEAEADQENSDIVGKVVLVGAIGVGAALIESALIPGMIIGAAAVLAPKFVPEIGNRLRPLFKSTIRGAYKLTEKTREAFAEAHEQVQDIMAEARHEDAEAAGATKPAAGATAPQA